jgi:hypothetical protein
VALFIIIAYSLGMLKTNIILNALLILTSVIFIIVLSNTVTFIIHILQLRKLSPRKAKSGVVHTVNDPVSVEFKLVPEPTVLLTVRCSSLVSRVTWLA